MDTNSRSFLLALALAFGLGCAAQSISTHLSATPVAAQSVPSEGIYQECISATVLGVSGRELSAGELPRETTRIPVGWRVVGGGGSGRPQPFVVLCR